MTDASWIQSNKRPGWAALLFTSLLLWVEGLPAGAQVPPLTDLAGDWQNAAEVRSLPALNSPLGSAQAVGDVLALGKLSFPPITLTGDTGPLLIDGQAPALEQTRWFPYQVLRRATAGNLAVETTTRMAYDQRGLLFHIVVTNNGTAPRTLELGIDLSAATSRHDRWGWGVPRDKDAAVCFSAMAMDRGRALLLRDSSNHLANCFGFARKPDVLSVWGNSGQAVWHATLKAHTSLTVNPTLRIGGGDLA